MASVSVLSHFFQLLPAAFQKQNCPKLQVCVWLRCCSTHAGGGLIYANYHRWPWKDGEGATEDQLVLPTSNTPSMVKAAPDRRGQKQKSCDVPPLPPPPSPLERAFLLFGSSAFPRRSLTLLFLIAFESDQLESCRFCPPPQCCHVSCVKFTCPSGKSEVKS